MYLCQVASVARAPFSDLHHMAQIQKSRLDLDIGLIMKLAAVSIVLTMVLLCSGATGIHCRFVMVPWCVCMVRTPGVCRIVSVAW